MSVLLIAGSPSERSRSAALLDAVAQRLLRKAYLVTMVIPALNSPRSYW